MLSPAQGKATLKYKSLKISSGSGTVGSNLTELFSTYNTLTADEKKRCIIIIGNSINNNNLILYPSTAESVSGQFGNVLYLAGHSYAIFADLSNKKYYYGIDTLVLTDGTSNAGQPIGLEILEAE